MRKREKIKIELRGEKETRTGNIIYRIDNRKEERMKEIILSRRE